MNKKINLNQIISCILTILFIIHPFSNSAYAKERIYGTQGTTSANGTARNIYDIDPIGWTERLVGTIATGDDTWATAKQPSTGKLFYLTQPASAAIGSNNVKQLKAWDPSNNTVTTIGTITGIGASDYIEPRLGFDSNGVLYIMTATVSRATYNANNVTRSNIYTLNTSTATATFKNHIYSDTNGNNEYNAGTDAITGTSLPSNNSGDLEISINPNTMYVVGGMNIFRIDGLSGAGPYKTTLLTRTGDTPAANYAGMAVTKDGTFYLSTVSNSKYKAIVTEDTVNVTLTTPAVATQMLDLGGNFTVNDISGFVYNDHNLNGTKDTGENGIGSQVYVKLCQNGNVKEVATVNNTTGAFSITEIINGTYSLVEANNNNTTNCTPSDFSSSWSSSTSNTRSITVSNADLINQNFGDYSKDFGDAPNSYGTTTASTGANHSIISTLKMGTNATDAESNGPATATGTTDDTTGTDDEDSFGTFPYLTNLSSTYSINVPVNNTTGSAANLRAWIDFNRNGTFDDNEASDLATTNVPNNTNGTISLTWSNLPSGISVGASYIRLRLTTQSLGISEDIGSKSDGEVEDYPITINRATDFGDLPDTYKTLLASGGPRHNISSGIYLGTNIDSEIDGQPSTNATGDNTNGINDEDGVIFNPTLYPGLLHLGQTNTARFNASVAGFVSMWIDYNNNGNFTDAGEQVFNDSAVVAGNNDKNFSIGTQLKYEYKNVRVRYSTIAGQSNTSTGLASNGEVEDYQMYLASFPNSCDTLTTLTGIIGNGGFEEPTISGSTQTSETSIPYWKTTSTDNLIEVWRSGFNDVIPNTGLQFAEINATQNAALYQDVITIPGTTVYIHLAHRGRNGVDVAAVKVGAPTGTLTLLGNVTDSNTAWGVYDFSYVVPAGQNVTRLQFEAISSTGVNASFGNFLDSVTAFTTTSCYSVDYGDAPDTYGTLNASSGAKHYTPTNTLKLGTNAGDSEADGQPNVGAIGDNTNSINDEDGVTSFTTLSTLTPSSTTYSLQVNVSNTSGNPSNLRGWIDFDGNGTFDDDEASTNLVVPTATTGNVILNWPAIPSGTTNGVRYARIRLTTDPLAETDDLGGKSNGEVEDYQINIGPTNFNITGKVFEDVNYGGGAGRNLVSSSGVVRSGSTVELYNSGGTYVSSTTTDASGVYTFSNLVIGTYTVRVINSTVTSSRAGYVSGLLPVQTFRTNASTGTAVAVTDYVGGQNPKLVDAANGVAGAVINTSTGAFTSGITGHAQSITTVTGSGTNITGVDFGFNFDTIVNTNVSGQGSLNQFIINSNALTNVTLAQVGQSAGREVSIFMIPNGVANPGQNTSYANQLNSYGAAQINIAGTALANVTGANTSIDGRTQTKNVRASGGGETNSGQSGVGGFVGVSQTYLAKFDNPEVEIVSANITGLTATGAATGFELRNLAFVRTRVLLSGNSSLIQDNLIGMNANGTETELPQSANYCVEFGGGTNMMTARHNYVKCDNSGIRRDNSGSNMLIEFNEVDRPSVGQSATYEAIQLIGAGSNDTIQYNLVKNQRGAGSELGYNPASVVNNLIVQENTYTNNGKELSGLPSSEPLGIIVRTINNSSIVNIRKNIIANNGGTGILVQDTRRVKISQNSIFNNGPTGSTFGTTANLGIDLRTGNNVDPNSMGTNIDGVTPNDGEISNLQANNGTDYPIITSAFIKGTTLKIQGFVGIAPGDVDFANSVLEFFLADDDGNNKGPIFVGDGKNVTHGEGKVYIDSCTTGSTGSFDCTFSNVNGLVAGQFLTATATNSNSDTSEFSNLQIVTEEPFLFYPNNAENALPGSTVIYSHEIVSSESGNVTLSATTDKGWSYEFFRDVNGNSLLDGPDTPYTGSLTPSLGNVYTLYPNHSVKILVKAFIPENTPMNTVDNFKITASLTSSATNVLVKTLEVQDITTVSSNQGGALKLLKAVAPTGNQPPGTNLTYTINYKNTGIASLQDIEIEDVVPANTVFVSASFSVGSTGTIIAPPVGGIGKITWTVTGNLNSGQSGSVIFVVKIKQ